VERNKKTSIVLTAHPEPPSSLENPHQERAPGSARGSIWIAADFDAPIPELERAFEDEELSFVRKLN
jgi:hypothetical protein